MFEATYREKIPEHDDELYNPKTPEHALVALAQYTQHWKNDPIDYEPVYTEVSGKVSIGTAIMSFRIDAVLRHRKPGFDKFLILEHKTTGASFSSQWQDEWQLDIQPATYLHAANCWFGPENVDCLLINGLCFLKTKKDFIRVPIQKTRGQMLVWLKTVQDAIGDINYQTSLLTEECKPEDYILEAFPLNPTNCRRFYMCSYHNFCMAWDNPLRVIAESNNEPPPGMKTDWWNPLEKPSNLVVDLEGVDIATQ